MTRPSTSRLVRRLIALALRTWPIALRHTRGRDLGRTLRTDTESRRGVAAGLVLLAGLIDIVRAGLHARAASGRRARRMGGPGAGATGAPGVRHRARALTRGLRADLTMAIAAVRARPGPALMVVLTLACGLGASTTMFSAVDAVLLRPLPYADDARLVEITEVEQARGSTGASLPALEDWRELPGLAAIGAYAAEAGILHAGGDAERVDGVGVSPGFFATLGLPALVGRTFDPDAPRFDPDPKMILSHALWQSRFGGDASVIGRQVALDQRHYTVVGVMPPEFAYPAHAQFWTTLTGAMEMIAQWRSVRYLEVVGRLAPGTSVGELRASLDAWRDRQAALDARAYAGHRPRVRPLRDAIVGPAGPALLVVFGGVGLLLVTACCNVAGVRLAGGLARQQDLAVRAALGATRARIVRQLSVEGLLLGLAGTGAAMALARATRGAVVALAADRVPRLEFMRTDWRVFAFAAAAGIATALVFSIGPALSLTRAPVSGHLRASGSRTVAGRGRGWRAFALLVSAEFALAVVLVAGAGLLLNSYLRLSRVDVGFRPGGLAAARITVPLAKPWTEDPTKRRFHGEFEQAVRALPGIRDAALVGRAPLEAVRGGTEISRPGRDVTAVPNGLLQVSSPGYFRTVGARLVEGRDFTDADVDTTERVAIVNDVLARALWGDASPVGQRLEFGYFSGPTPATVIGVVHRIQYDDLSAELRPELYLTYRQAIVVPMQLVFRADGDPVASVPAIRAALARVEPGGVVTLDQVTRLDARIGTLLAPPRFYLMLVASFALMALLLAALGIYGTLSFWLGERRRELGIRLALGASPGALARRIVGRGLILAGAGLAAGLVLTLAGGRLVAHLLYGVTPADAPTLAGASLALVLVALGACALPARRAMGVDAVEVMR
ncbi:MAG: ADOP family duplicated permease [Vicinamibacterales bacterium]